jgi:hypothetical protein
VLEFGYSRQDVENGVSEPVPKVIDRVEGTASIAFQ